MKLRTLPVKRRPAQTSIFRRLHAVTRNRKQRVAAADATEMDFDDGSSRISRVLTIIFLIHIVAIGLIFIHQKFLDQRPAEEAAVKASPAAAAPVVQRAEPKFSNNDRIYVVQPGDNWQRIAMTQQVDEGDLRLANEHREIGPGSLLTIPPRRIVAEEPPELTAIREHTPPDTDRGLVEAIDVSNAPRAQLIKPNRVPPITGGMQTGSQSAARTPAVAGKTYVVQNGDTIWRISNRNKVSQESIMKANGITDARKIRAGMSLVIPSN